MATNGNGSGGLLGVDPDLVTNIGLGLLSAAKFGGNLGDSLSQAYQNYQTGKIRNQQLQSFQLQNAIQRMRMGAAAQELGGQQAPQGSPVPGAPAPAPAGPAPMGQQVSAGIPATQSPQATPAPSPRPYTAPSENDIYGGSVQGISPGYLRMNAILSDNPSGQLNSTRDLQLKLAQQRYAPQVQKLQSVVTSDSPTRDIAADPDLQSAWIREARLRGIDPQRGFNDQNARQVFASVANQYRSTLGESTEAPPAIYDQTTGAYGYRGQRNRITGEEKQVQGREMPTYGAVGERFDPGTGTNSKVYAQTGGWGAFGSSGAPQRGGGLGPPTSTNQPAAAGNTGGAREVGSINLGMPAPTDKEFNAAKNSQLMLTSQQRMQALDSKGFDFTPKARTIILQALTNESTSNIEQFGIQEGLRHGLSKDEQTYMTALTPFLQAAGHAWGQAGIGRLTPTMARQMFETIAPFDARNKDAMANMADNRQNLYVSALAETGAARQTPLYKNSIGADYDRLAAKGGLQAKPFPLPQNRAYNPATGKIE